MQHRPATLLSKGCPQAKLGLHFTDSEQKAELTKDTGAGQVRVDPGPLNQQLKLNTWGPRPSGSHRTRPAGCCVHVTHCEWGGGGEGQRVGGEGSTEQCSPSWAQVLGCGILPELPFLLLPSLP